MYLFCAICLKKINELEKAAQILLACSEAFPIYEEAICLLGKIELQLQKYPEAINHFKSLARISPNKGDYFVHLTEGYLANGEFAKCIDICGIVISRFQENTYDAKVINIKCLIRIDKLPEAMIIADEVDLLVDFQRLFRPRCDAN
jgi:tetratricopeptide (TPR) repeat protein